MLLAVGMLLVERLLLVQGLLLVIDGLLIDGLGVLLMDRSINIRL